LPLSAAAAAAAAAAVGLGFVDGDEREERNGTESIQSAARASNAKGKGILDHMDLGYVCMPVGGPEVERSVESGIPPLYKKL